MSRRQLSPIVPERIRRIQGSFGWIDHRFINEEHIRRCEKDEILLYFFLIAVANRQGLSWWGDGGISSVLGMKPLEVISARMGLIDKYLLAYREGLYQVLSLPELRCGGGLESIGEVLRGLLTGSDGGKQ
jgi:hypothetical protein